MLGALYRQIDTIDRLIERTRQGVIDLSFACGAINQPVLTVETIGIFGITADIPVATWAPRGSQESVDNIVKQLQQHPTVPAVLLDNHGLLTFAVHPDPVSGMHCWHQKVTLCAAHANDRYGDVSVDPCKARRVYQHWLDMTRPQTHRPDGLRRPLWMLRPYRPAADAFTLKPARK